LGVFTDRPFLELQFLLLCCALPAFLGGVIEDLTHSVSPRIRLWLSAISALLGVFVLGAFVYRADFRFFDMGLNYPILSVLFTVLVVVGLTNAINIIDGFNGLASAVVIIILLGIFYVGFKCSDYFIMLSSLMMLGAITGFLVWNYPLGLIFLGDGGAYLLGFILSQLSILLVARNPQVSAWFVILINLYPVTETLFSIYRKKFLRKISPTEPDALHFHMLIYRRLIRWVEPGKKIQLTRNALTAPYLWMMTLMTVLPALLFWDQKWPLIGFCCNFVVIYVWLYVRIVKFRSPPFLILRRPEALDGR
jgi:UDP-N-acetylmuramyl pentapeptide phosphotransferase/UDP-N-acetylglucosamine-1-phosphate transferase